MTLARDAYRRARALLAANRECLDDLAANALERETLTREDLDEIFAAHELRRTLLPKNEESEVRRLDRTRPVTLDRCADATAHTPEPGASD